MSKEITIQFPIRPHAKQWEIFNCDARFLLNVSTRRFGKTEIAKMRAMVRAPKGRVWWVVQKEELGFHVFEDFITAFQDYPGVYINRTMKLITFPKTEASPRGGFFQIVSADSHKRGMGLEHVVIDEASEYPPELWYEEIGPMLMDNMGSADFLCTPKGKNWVWDLYNMGISDDFPEWKVFNYSIHDNPRVPDEEKERIRRNVPDRVWRQEYLAEFLDDGGAVFQFIRDAVDPALEGPDVTPVGGVSIGIDWGRKNDYTVLIAMDEAGRVIDINRFREIPWAEQYGHVEAMARKWKATNILAEANSIGDVNIDMLLERGLAVRSFMTTNASKKRIIDGLAVAFEQRQIKIPNNQTLLAELQMYTVNITANNNYQYGAPKGLHDDMVMALAIAVEAAMNPMVIDFAF